MIRIDAVIARFPVLDEQHIVDWVARGWVSASGVAPAEWQFTDIDVARLLLLRDLHVALAMDEETLSLVLSLLDQVYGLRRTLRTVMDAVNQSPEDVRRRILDALTSATPNG
jgi:chaperone modulatory protein CbpM